MQPLTDALLSLVVRRPVPSGTAADILSVSTADFGWAERAPINEIAMFLAQTGWETGGYRFFEEKGTVPGQYEGRLDLGNVHPGDGALYIGRGAIQLTGRDNYEHFQGWLACRGDSVDVVKFPTLVAQNPLRWTAATWYWATRPGLRGAAQGGDVATVTSLITGARSRAALDRVRLDRRAAYYQNALLALEAL